MRFFRRLAGILGFGKDGHHDNNEDEDEPSNNQTHNNRHHNQHNRNLNRGDEPIRTSKGGFGVKVPVVVDRPNLGPILVPCNHADGGVQGLMWYTKRLRIDEDGDVADEFLDEVLPPAEVLLSTNDRRQLPNKFEVKYNTKPAKVRKQMITTDGRVQQSVEYHGKLQWV